jgi:hypothetical protein
MQHLTHRALTHHSTPNNVFEILKAKACHQHVMFVWQSWLEPSVVNSPAARKVRRFFSPDFSFLCHCVAD